MSTLDDLSPKHRALRLRDMRERLHYGSWDVQDTDDECPPLVYCAACERRLREQDRRTRCFGCGSQVRALEDDDTDSPTTLLGWELIQRRQATSEGLALLSGYDPALLIPEIPIPAGATA